ncbi:MAG: extracellular solute-binding protein [Paralcaligenes sp.]
MKTVLTRTLTLIACSVSLAFGIPGSEAVAQGSQSNATEQGISSDVAKLAKQEGSVTWYSVFDPDQMAKLVQDFQSKHDIKINIIRSTGGSLIQRYSSELNAGKVTADIFSISNPLYYHDETEKGTFKKFTDKDLPNLKNWPKDAVLGDSTVLLSINPFVIAYNTELIKPGDAPKTWADLLSPSLRGKIGSPNFAVAPTYVQFLNMWKNTLGSEFLKKFKDQKKRYFDSSVPGNQALAAGELAVFAPTMPVFAQPLIKKGAPVKFVFVPGTTGNPIYAAVSTKAPHPNAAMLFMNYLLSGKAQQMINEGVAATLLPGVDGSLKLPEKYQAPNPIQARDRANDLLSEVGLTN